jgi:hypothetical protein
MCQRKSVQLYLLYFINKSIILKIEDDKVRQFKTEISDIFWPIVGKIVICLHYEKSCLFISILRVNAILL